MDIIELRLIAEDPERFYRVLLFLRCLEQQPPEDCERDFLLRFGELSQLSHQDFGTPIDGIGSSDEARN